MIAAGFRRSCLVVTAALGLAAVAAGLAVAAASPDDLGKTVAHAMFKPMNLSEIVRQTTMTTMSSMDGVFQQRPQWRPLLVKAIGDEMEHDLPAIDALIGRQLAAKMSPEELRAGLVILRDPSVKDIITDASQKAPTTPPAEFHPGKEAAEAAQSPAGKSFLTKISDFGTLVGPDTTNQLRLLILPGAMRRFGEAAGTAEQTAP